MFKKLCSSLTYSDAFEDDIAARPDWNQPESLSEFSEAANAAVVAMVGLTFEAKIAAGPGVLAVCRRSSARAAELLQGGLRRDCCGIISFGIAGGLAPDLLPGDCVVASTIIDRTTSCSTDAVWSRHLSAAIPNARSGAIVGVDRVIADPQHKKDLHAATGAIAVDMESHLVARLAAVNGLAFAAVRVVVDPAHRVVPTTAVAGMAPDGSADLTAMSYALMESPSQIFALLRLAADVYVARAALLRLRRTVGPLFGHRVQE